MEYDIPESIHYMDGFLGSTEEFVRDILAPYDWKLNIVEMNELEDLPVDLSLKRISAVFADGKMIACKKA